MADSAYSHLALGVFFSDEFNTLENYNNEPFFKTYYFFNGICVSADPSFCQEFLSSNKGILQNPLISLYPNPSKSQLSFDSQEKITNVNVYDLTGRTIVTYECQDNCSTISINDLANGTYIISLTLQNSIIWNSKFIKN